MIVMSLSICHPNRINKGRGMCGVCYDRWLKANNAEYRRRQIENTSDWFRLHPERRKLYNNTRRAREMADPTTPQRKRERMLRSHYGITQLDYDQMLGGQEGGCAICFRRPGKRPLHVDHCHETGRVRGLLCHQCNWYLGTVDNDKTVLDRLIRYIGSKPVSFSVAEDGKNA
jgi:hypothetical protein